MVVYVNVFCMKQSTSESAVVEQSTSPFLTLSELLHPFVELPKKFDREVWGIATDSRHVKPGYVFIAHKGYGKYDGRDFISDALSCGAVAIISELSLEQDTKTAMLMPAQKKNALVPHIQLSKLTSIIGHIASKFYQQPSRQMQMFGVTGTNGKTTITTLLARTLNKLSLKTAQIGTHGQGVDDKRLNFTGVTTPGPVDLQAMLAGMRDDSCEAVAMEVSSHGISQHRVVGVDFDTLILSNVSRDHLDFHGSIANYRAAKRRFLTEYTARHLVVNLDDSLGKEVCRNYQGTAEIIGYTLQNASDLYFENTLRAHQIESGLEGISMLVSFKDITCKLKTRLVGTFNAYNLMAIIASLLTMDFELEQIVDALRDCQPVVGRMEVFGGGDKPLVVVDYAHTPAALEEVLLSLQRYCERKLICVFGCGGNRDKGKRRLMGQVAERYADHIIITDDNPRFESSQSIVADILKGVLCPWAVQTIHDRSEALVEAITSAHAGDVVLIAGKGHENYQIVGNERTAFCDKEKVQFLLNLKTDL